MVDLYIWSIRHNLLTLQDVPSAWKEAVDARLKEMADMGVIGMNEYLSYTNQNAVSFPLSEEGTREALTGETPDTTTEDDIDAFLDAEYTSSSLDKGVDADV